MIATKTSYIALGSNKGDKLTYLQSAVNAIFETIGAVKKISKVYKTPALGFDGDDFFNACILVQTELQPLQLLNALKQIEADLGRTVNEAGCYVSREIDLDILFYEDQVVNEDTLIIPHPELHKRNFVLQPLCDIAKDLKHSVFNLSITRLLSQCQDESFVVPINIWLKNPKSQYNFTAYNTVAIEGNIGAGKTSVATKIAQDFNAKLILERFADNPFLPKFYKNPERYAFALEMSFLAERYQQFSEDFLQLDLFKDFVVSDYDIHKSLIFSKVTLSEDEFRLYRKLFYQVYKDVAKPDLYVYLRQNTWQLERNIKKRGRKYEENIDKDYLEKINSGYLEFLKSQTDLVVKIIDVSGRDFIKNRADYMWLLKLISTSA